MARLRIWINRALSAIRRQRLERELDAEIQSHIEMRTDDNLRQGMTPDDARLSAMREFGGVDQIKERYRDLRGVPFLESLFQEVRFAFRTLTRNPAFTVVAIITLALGMGINTAIFSVINAVLLRPLPYGESDRLVWIWSVNSETPLKQRVSYPDFLDWRGQNQVFEDLVGWNEYEPTLTGAGEAQRVRAELTIGNLFTVLRVPPMLGTIAEADKDRPQDPSVVLSHNLWQRTFASDPDVVGRRITLDGFHYTVAAVMPAGFQFPIQSPVPLDAWVRVQRFNPALANRRDARLIEVMGRLKPNTTAAQAQAEMDRIATILGNQYPKTNRTVGVRVVTAIEEVTGNASASLLALFGAVACVLSIAAVNVANMHLTQAMRRRRELTVRAAIGASRSRIAVQLLIESLLIGLTAGIIGSLAAFWTVDTFRAWLPQGIPRINQIAVDLRVLGFTGIVSLAVGLIFGMAPARYALQIDPGTAPLESMHDGFGRRRGRGPQSLLVVGQIALAMILLCGAGLFVNSFWRLNRSGTGFDPRGVLTFRLNLSSQTYREPAQAFAEIQARLQTIPGVSAASMGLQLPDRGIAAANDTSPFFEVEGRPVAPGVRPRSATLTVQPGYFRTMGIPLLTGRDFSETDRPLSPRVIIVNQSLAQMYLSGEDPIGKHLKLDSWVLPGQPAPEIIGVVADVKHNGVIASQPLMYIPMMQFPRWGSGVVVRTAGDPATFVPAVRDVIQSFDKDLAIYDVRVLDGRIAESLARERFSAVLLGMFSTVAVTLAAVGLYGVLSFLVAQRTREISIRIALGAEARAVLNLVLREGLKLTLTGIAIGVLGALALSRLVQGLLFGVSSTDPYTFAATSLVLFAAAALAAWIPARRASRADPMIALRYN